MANNNGGVTSSPSEAKTPFLHQNWELQGCQWYHPWGNSILHVMTSCGESKGWLLMTILSKMVTNMEATTCWNQNRHYSVNIKVTGLPVVPSLRYFDALCRDVLWWEQRLIVDDEFVQNGNQQGSFHPLKQKTPLLHLYQRYRAASGTILEVIRFCIWWCLVVRAKVDCWWWTGPKWPPTR